MAKHDFKPDLKQGARFIELLTGSKDTPVTFQLFDDSPEKRPGLIKIINSTFPAAAEHLADQNQWGAGVFVTVNETDGTGRKAGNITGIRAVFADFDSDDSLELVDAAKAKLQPSIEVSTSGNKRHLYWLVSDCTVAQFPDLIDKLVAAVGSDKGAKGVNRVLRIPGFYHCKGEPRRVQVVGCRAGLTYTVQQIVDAFGLDAVQEIAPGERHGDRTVLGEQTIHMDQVIHFARHGELTVRAAMALVPAAKDQKLRCDTPWRESTSEDAGIFRLHEDGSPFIIDSGDNTRHELHADDKAAYQHSKITEDFAEELASVEERREQQQKADQQIGEGEPAPLKNRADILTADEMVQRFAYISDGQLVVDRGDPRVVYPLHEFKQAHIASWTPTPTRDDPNAKTSSTKLWMFAPGKLQVHTLTWHPGAKEITRNPMGQVAYNTFKARKLPPFVFDQAHVDRFLNHVVLLFADRADDFLNWFAHIEQHPGELPHTAWLHVASNLGLGRNWLAGLAVRLWPGEVAANYDLAGTIDSNFNGALSHKRLVIVDEIRASGTAGHKLEQRLKSIITEEHRLINPKYGHQSVEHNCARWLLFSNHRSAIPMSEGDRRYEVKISDATPEDTSYYSAIYKLLSDKNFILSVLDYLRKRDISMFNPGARAKLTGDKEQAIRTSGSDFRTSVGDAITSYTYDMITAEQVRGLAGISNEEFERGGTSFNHIMEDFGWIKVGRKKLTWIGERKVAVYARSSMWATLSKAKPVDHLPDQATYEAHCGRIGFD